MTSVVGAGSLLLLVALLLVVLPGPLRMLLDAFTPLLALGAFEEVAGAVEGERARRWVVGRYGGLLAGVAGAGRWIDNRGFAAADAGVVDVESVVGVLRGEARQSEEEDVVAGFRRRRGRPILRRGAGGDQVDAAAGDGA